MLNTRRMRIFTLCECAIMLALSVVLSYVKIFSLPFDGSITLFSMLPICLISIKYGIAWGLGTAFCYSWFQILQGGVFAWGLTPGMLVASLVNLFLRSEAIYYALSYVGVAIFCGLTAWDTQKIMRLNDEYGYGIDEETFVKLSIICALQLYLDFINIFLYLLRIFGRGNRS